MIATRCRTIRRLKCTLWIIQESKKQELSHSDDIWMVFHDKIAKVIEDEIKLLIGHGFQHVALEDRKRNFCLFAPSL